jgi:cytochrome c oxidase cbb3-type subunit III
MPIMSPLPFSLRAIVQTSAALMLTAWIAPLQAQNPANPNPSVGEPDRQRPAQAAARDRSQNGQSLFSAHCGFCHGRDAAGGETGADLTQSALVAEDVDGDKIGPVVRNGRLDRGMPAFKLPDEEVAAIVAFIQEQHKKAASQPGSRRSVDLADLQTGNADAGQQYFNGAGGCAKCHSAIRDLAGIGTRLKGLPLLRRMLYPRGERDAASRSAATVKVTLPSGQTVIGTLAYRDEFTIALTDSSGSYRSWPTSQVKFTVDDPLDAHVEQLGRYTDDDIHNVLAYLQTLR